jgi:amino acid permease
MAVERDLGNRNWWTEFRKAAMRAKASPLLLRRAADAKGSGSSGGGGGDEEGAGLSRRLGLVDLILLGIGASIGAGIFVVTGTVAHDAGPGTLQKLSNCYQFSGIFILRTGASVSGPQLQAKNFLSNSIAPGAC